MDTSENNAKISDSAYSNSCSNSQSRKSHSSKSTNWGSHSSGSSGYGGKPSNSGSSNQPPEKKTKENKPKKKKKVRTEVTETQVKAECRPLDPAPILEVPDEEQIHVDQTPLPVLPMDTGPVPMDISPPDTFCAKVENSSCNVSNANAPINFTSSQPSPSSSDGFICVISMHDGVVMYTTASLTTTLGFLKDMWIGRSFIDFLHPMDRNTFSSQITSGLAVPKIATGLYEKVQIPEKSTSTLACRIRKYRTLKAGYGVKERAVTYIPFQLKLTFKNVSNEGGAGGEVIYLVIQATPIFSAFKVPNEVVAKPMPFVIRHAADGNLEYIDPESVQYLGYLPRDVIGKDALQFYHPEDLCLLKHVYETIVKEGGFPRSQPYRMLAQNGHFVRVETEWSSFINPWSRKLEFVIGKHYIIEGPTNPEVFQAPDVKLAKVQEEERYKHQLQRDTIIKIMNEVLTKPAEAAKLQMSKKCQDVASFMESLIEVHPKTDEELPLEIQDAEHSYFERDSMLGGISPHHEYTDSKSSTETPLSYNQINYNETLQRYFNSHEPLSYDDYTTVTEDNVLVFKDLSLSSGSFGKNGVQSTTVTKKHMDHFGRPSVNSPPLVKPGPLYNPILMNSLTPEAQLSADSEDMASSCESGLPMRGSSHCLLGDYQPVRLTEALLTKHNTDMEKELFRMHREIRSSIKEEREKTSNETRMKKKEHLARCNASFQPTSAGGAMLMQEPTEGRTKAVKRPLNQIESGTSCHKHHCSSSRQNRHHTNSTAVGHPSATITTTVAATHWLQSPTNNMSCILGVGMPMQMPLMNPVIPQQMPMHGVPGMFPVYFTPTPTMPSTLEMNTQDSAKTNHQFQVPASMFPMNYSPTPTMPSSSEMHLQNPAKTNNLFQAPASMFPINYSPTPSMPSSSETHLQNLAKTNNLFQTPPAMQCMMYGQPVYGYPFMYSPIGLQVPYPMQQQPMTTQTMQYSNFVNPLGLPISNYQKRNEVDSRTAFNKNSNDKRLKMSSSEETTDKTDGESSYSSFFKTESGSGTEKKEKESADVKKTNNKNGVYFTSELVYKYQILAKSMDEVLLADRQRMSKFAQPPLVNEQLGQLYLDLQLEGVASRLTLEEGVTSSSSSGEENSCNSSKLARRKREYSKLVMIYEENAPLPPAEKEEATPSSSAN